MRSLRESFSFRGYPGHQNQRRDARLGTPLGPAVPMTLHKVYYTR